MIEGYKFTFWNRDEWYHSDCWANPKKTAERFPQCVAMSEKLAQELIEADIKQREWDKKHPGEFKSFYHNDIPSHRGPTGTKQQEDCIEYFLANAIYFSWFEKSDAYKAEEEIMRKQIESYYKTLADNPERATDALDCETRSYWHKRLYEQIEEAKKIL